MEPANSAEHQQPIDELMAEESRQRLDDSEYRAGIDAWATAELAGYNDEATDALYESDPGFVYDVVARARYHQQDALAGFIGGIAEARRRAAAAESESTAGTDDLRSIVRLARSSNEITDEKLASVGWNRDLVSNLGSIPLVSARGLLRKAGIPEADQPADPPTLTAFWERIAVAFPDKRRAIAQGYLGLRRDNEIMKQELER